jgi:hypothetical protein
MLHFSTTNSKLNILARSLGFSYKQVISFDLPAGHSCPAARECLCKADRVTGKITDGLSMQFRCYAASVESRYQNTRIAHWDNFEAVKETGMKPEFLPQGVKVVRIHSSGDFFNEAYFLSWVETARAMPEVNFFGYTKMANFLIKHADILPQNFKITYSYGGILDKVASGLPTCYVVQTSDDCVAGTTMACEDDKSDDYYLIIFGKSFSLAVHGTQPAKRVASKSKKLPVSFGGSLLRYHERR